jgi:hypothetical protein
MLKIHFYKLNIRYSLVIVIAYLELVPGIVLFPHSS